VLVELEKKWVLMFAVGHQFDQRGLPGVHRNREPCTILLRHIVELPDE
jgi:hypothetical protein